jgi:tetratricopeptide (TPR) repeat protein
MYELFLNPHVEDSEMPTDRTASRLSSAAVKLCVAALLVFAAGASLAALGRQDDPERERAFKLWEAQNFVDATPLLEKLAQKYPDDPSVLGRLGFSLYATSTSIKDPSKRQEVRARALQVLRKSREAGDNSNLSRITLDALEAGDATAIPFSNIRDAEKEIRDAEESFVRGDLDKALAGYKRALELDPRLYEAALYAGDMYFKKGLAETDARWKGELLSQAGEWFAKAVRINADRETAHRYWGDALAAQDKRDDAREHFVDAIVAEPYTRNAWVGLVQWGDKYGVRLAHPRVEVPKSPAEAAGDPVWSAYASTRAAWRSRRFAETYPSESAYRHSLAEEAAALRALADAASKAGWTGAQLTPTLQNVIELNKAGLLEAFILIALPDEGISQDYEVYRKANRDKLRRYMLEYVAGGKN